LDGRDCNALKALAHAGDLTAVIFKNSDVVLQAPNEDLSIFVAGQYEMLQRLVSVRDLHLVVFALDGELIHLVALLEEIVLVVRQSRHGA